MAMKHVEQAFRLARKMKSARDFKVLMGICFDANPTGTLETTQGQLGQSLGCSRFTVGDALGPLENAGYIKTELIAGGRGNADLTQITLTLEQMQKARSEEKAKILADAMARLERPRRRPGFSK